MSSVAICMCFTYTQLKIAGQRKKSKLNNLSANRPQIAHDSSAIYEPQYSEQCKRWRGPSSFGSKRVLPFS